MEEADVPPQKEEQASGEGTVPAEQASGADTSSGDPDRSSEQSDASEQTEPQEVQQASSEAAASEEETSQPSSQADKPQGSKKKKQKKKQEEKGDLANPGGGRQSPLIDRFLSLLVNKKGSDLHIAAGEPPRLRIDGTLRKIDYPSLTPAQVKRLMEQIMGENQQKELIEERDVDFAYESESLGRFRVNAYYQLRGMGAAFRVVPTKIPTPEDINMPVALRRMALQNKGLVLVTGPTGSGKSTTLAALVNLINKHRRAHIITIEDPIEFVHESKRALINQREIGQHAAGFARALRSALREDPDVILVGELRDLETMSLAITAAETGHLVLGTLHTMSAAKTIDRLVDSFPAGQQSQIRTQLSEALEAVVAQTLLPRKDTGRIAAFEVLINNKAVSNLIRESKTHQLRSLIQTHKTEGMQLLDASMVNLVEKGFVSPEEVIHRASDEKYIKKELHNRGLVRRPQSQDEGDS